MASHARNLLIALLLAWSASGSLAAPQRIVSLNLCADELVLRLADPAQIASVTWLSQDPANANLAALASRYPANRGLSEEVIALAPDLVIAGRYTTRATVDQLKRVVIEVLELDVPASFEQTEQQILELGDTLGHLPRAEALIARMRARLASLDTARQHRPTAIVYQPNGFTAGKGSLIDTLLARAGFRNLAAENGLDNYGAVPLELLVAFRPDVLILNAEPTAPALAYEVLRHPVLKALPHTQVVSVPPRLWTCAGPEMVEAVALLARAAEQIAARATP
ncbi:ABC transporter substrate-binding protein [Rhodoligotrophos defluvii]|uniref:ABC transporter substrate-binding protein n=1 Tax=Rhodoligotrophos defluvii TaxID=2561934 RepID=UPI0010C9A7F8|nr:ABC transporter substrate-binding protein [Rhodoligotrophos defluvii]